MMCSAFVTEVVRLSRRYYAVIFAVDKAGLTNAEGDFTSKACNVLLRSFSAP